MNFLRPLADARCMDARTYMAFKLSMDLSIGIFYINTRLPWEQISRGHFSIFYFNDRRWEYFFVVLQYYSET